MMVKRTLLCAALGMLMSPLAFAGNYTATGSGDPGGSGNLVVTFAGDGATVDTEVTFTYDNTNITLGAGVASNGALCLSPSATSIRVVPPSGGATPLTSTQTTYCTYPVTVGGAAPAGLVAFNTMAIECSNAMAGSETCTVSAGAGFTVTNNVPPTIGAGAFVAGSPSGTEGVVTAIGNINFPITSPAGGSNTGSVQCADAAGGPTFSFTPSTAVTVDSSTVSPVSIGVSCPLSPNGGGAVNGDATCTVTDSAGTRMETISIDCPEGAMAMGPTLTPQATTNINLPVALVGSQSNTSIVFTAGNDGNAGQSTPLNCTATAPATIVSGGSQSVMTGSQPAPVVAGIVLTGAAQVGTVTCNGTVYTLNAPAGVVFVPPTVIPASSFWSQLSLIALFAALGGLFVAFRRNA
ncbi:hypothetical protein [Pseudomarimonas arenosa]|uniref:IPTL-CTERM protein sorting domain-containing protein n=1 Tax=Pseudomarimonas arenosa TaxID=2774145 RepID=A0AAW3ZT18_9GAMM|nr:hypothetical protein [Pseudomarimonas arenosa]MBD8527331.1 hypothetical protein [Pseudomarimonas arenosa]